MTTDSPEAVAAKSEDWADRKAKRRPMTPIAQARQDPFAIVKEYAGCWGKLVMRGKQDAGESDEEVQAARVRMMDWMVVCETYHRETRKVLRDQSIPQSDRTNLLSDMLAAQEYERRARFG